MNESTTLQAGEQFISGETREFLNLMLLGMPNWKWLALAGGLVLLYFLRFLVRWILLKIKKAEAYFPPGSFMSFFLEEALEKSLSWIVVAGAGLVLLAVLQPIPPVALYVGLFLKLFLAVNIVRTCYMAAEAFGASIQEWAKTTETALDDQLAPFASKTLKVVVLVIGVLVALQNFGVNVTALLAGLGIGGIALAFAAQDTVANVFGTVTILLDGPFKLGEHIKIGDTEGIVEEVGFRSTSVRTFYNSLVSLPNSLVAKEKIDNMSRRNGWIRFRHILGFTYDATPEQLHKFAENLRYQLLQDPSVDRERILVNFNGYGDSSLNVLVNFHFHINADETDPGKSNQFLDLIFVIANQFGLSFAFPTRTLMVQNAPTGPVPGPLPLPEVKP